MCTTKYLIGRLLLCYPVIQCHDINDKHGNVVCMVTILVYM